jgi:hypothetical protein
MENKIEAIIKNFNINYNRFKKYISSEFDKSGDELLKLFGVVEFFSKVEKVGDCISLYDDKLINNLLPEIDETKEMISLIEKGDKKFFSKFPIDKFEKNNINTGIKSGKLWQNIENLPDSSIEKLNYIMEYFKIFVKLYKCYHILAQKKS